MTALEKHCGARRGYGCAACIEFDINFDTFQLPPPATGDHYMDEELRHIIDIWNKESEYDHVLNFAKINIH